MELPLHLLKSGDLIFTPNSKINFLTQYKLKSLRRNMASAKKSDLLSPILCIAIIFGLSNKTTKRLTIFFNVLRCTYNVLFVVISGYTILVVYSNIKNGYDPLMGIELVIKIVVSNLTGVAMAVSGFLNQRKFMHVITLMKTREEELLKYTKSVSCRNIKLFMCSQFVLLFLLQGHNLLITYFRFCKNVDDLMASCIGSWLAFNLFPLLSFVHSIMFSTIILIIKRHFFIINNTLLQSKLKCTECANLQLLKKMHSHLIRDSKEIMKIFSIPTLFKFLDGVLMVFCCTHLFITEFKTTSVPLRAYAAEASMMSLNAALVPIAELLTVILVCQKTSAESLHMGVVLHKLYAVCKRQGGLVKIVSFFGG